MNEIAHSLNDFLHSLDKGETTRPDTFRIETQHATSSREFYVNEEEKFRPDSSRRPPMAWSRRR